MLTTKNWGSSVIMALLGVVMLGGCTPSGTRALLDGHRLLREKKFPQAIEKLKAATQTAPEAARAKAWNFLGLAYHGSGKPAEAVAAYQKAIQLNANYAAPHFNLGSLWLEQNNWQAAISQLGTFTGLEREHLAGWTKIGTAQLRGQELDAAERSFQNALKLNPASAEALNGLGIVQLQRKRLRESIDYFSASIRAQADYGPAHLNLAVISQHYFGDRPAALQRYRNYLLTQPPVANAQSVQRVVKQLEMELMPPAIVAATNLVASNPLPAQVVVTVTNYVPKSAAPEPALNRLAPQTNIMVAMLPKPSINNTVPLSTPEQRTAPPPLPAPVVRSQEQTNVTHAPPPPDDPAKSELRAPAGKLQVVQIPDESPPKPGQPILTNATEAPAPSHSAATNENSAGRTNIHSGDAGMLLVRSKPKPSLGERLNPLNWFRETEKPAGVEVPSNSERSTNQPAVAASQTKPQIGSVERSRIVPPQPAASRIDYPRYRYRSPAKPVTTGNRKAAEPHFSQGLQAHKERRLAAAIEAYKRAIDLDPSYYEAHYNSGLAAYDLRDLSRSLAAYEMALAVRPDSLDARFNFALSLIRANHPLDAAGELEKALGDYPEEARVHFMLAKICAEQLNEIDAARRHYRRVLELDPRHPSAIPIRYWLAEHPLGSNQK